MQIKVEQTRHYGKVSQCFAVVLDTGDYEGASTRDIFTSGHEMLVTMFEDWETHQLSKLNYKAAEVPGTNQQAQGGNQVLKAIGVFKEVKEGKESIRVRTAPGTYYNKYGVIVYEDSCDGYDILVKLLGNQYQYSFDEKQQAMITVDTVAKKGVSFDMQVPF